MIRKFLYWLSGNLPCRLIKLDGIPYLERYLLLNIESLGIKIYLHRFIQSDSDRYVHNHPFNAVAFILVGGYKEKILKSFDLNIYTKEGEGNSYVYRNRRCGSINPIPRKKFHQIVEGKPETWTIFIRGKRRGSWGFLEETPSKKHLKVVPYKHAEESHGWEKRVPLGKYSERELYNG